MLKSIEIENYALIQSLAIDLPQGMISITGETGAGKSILLGAIGLITGVRADVAALKDNQKKCVVEGVFDVKNLPKINDYLVSEDFECFDELIIRREINPNGRSRAFVNDSPASLAQLKMLGVQLVDIHSQNQSLSLAKEEYQLEVVDTLAQNQKERTAYRTSFKKFSALKKELNQKREEAQNWLKELDYWKFQYSELEELDLKEGQIQELQEELSQFQNVEIIKDSVQGVDGLLFSESGVIPNLNNAVQLVSQLNEAVKDSAEWKERFNSVIIELDDLGQEIVSKGESVEYDPNRQVWIEDKLNNYFSLERKHNFESEGDFFQLKEDLGHKIQQAENVEFDISDLEATVVKAESELKIKAEALSNTRKKSLAAIQAEVVQKLSKLGMASAQLKIDLTTTEDYSLTGVDQIQFLFTANKGGRLEPIGKVASGGEVSRVMLCIKSMLAKYLSLPTVIFDEIDTGVSGEIAAQMGHMIKEMSESTQTIAITHLPQFAAKANTQLKVFKTEDQTSTSSQIKVLSSTERVEELARLLSGAELSDAAIKNAQHLLAQS